MKQKVLILVYKNLMIKIYIDWYFPDIIMVFLWFYLINIICKRQNTLICI
ncbi:hypothetical protein pb186bvf_014882 [Paramecium bursaria]